MRNSGKMMLRSAASTAVLIAALGAPTTAWAQSAGGEAQVNSSADDTDVIVVTGIRQSLASALQEKRSSDNLVEVIQAEDIGKLPDQNLAEVLENVTGIQIDRSAGVGTGVQIRGTDANRVEINGVSTVGSGNGRSGISFDDLPAALIASVEVIKVPEASTIEGSVGGTINLRTIRPLDLDDPVLSFRAQVERSDLAQQTTPRFSGTVGNSWDTEAGEFGVVLSASYAELSVAQFDPRFDRDRVVLPGSGLAIEENFAFLRTQFLDQQITRFEYETLNFAGTVEWKPADNIRLYVDGVVNKQDRIQQSARAFLSGIGGDPVSNNSVVNSFETVDLGTIDGPNGPLNLGEVQAVLTGVRGVGVNPGNGAIDPNLRTSTTTTSRVTDSSVFAGGAEWNAGRFTVNAEISRSVSDSVRPGLNAQLDFINPNGPQPVFGESSDNGTPGVFDARDGTLQFGIAQGLAETPTAAQLLDPANYRLRSIGEDASTNDNSETAFRVDVNWDADGILPLFSSVDFGYRRNISKAENTVINSTSRFQSATAEFFRPQGDQFADFIVAGPDNFDAADGRELFFRDYLILDPVAAIGNTDAVLSGINDAIAATNQANGVNLPMLSDPAESLDSFFDIEEKTHALYLQGNFDTDLGSIPIRGNVGIRWVQTDLTSVGNNVINGVVQGVNVQSSSYDFFLPRFNFVAEPAANLLIRGGISRDMRRPDFDDLSTSIAFGGNAARAVNVGNPALQPETVWSFDVASEYYFSNTGLISLGFFHKRRTNLFSRFTESPEEIRVDGQVSRDITDPCENGGIFNPNADRNVFSPTQGTGICVPLSSSFNANGVSTQTGIEVAFQYDLSDFEDTLGFASGFGFIGNFTYQKDGGTITDFLNGSGDANSLNLLLGRSDTVMSDGDLSNDVVQQLVSLTDLSNYSYNATLFYDKYGINFRARYSWRSDFLSSENPISFDLPRVVDDRGQLNASLSYAINDHITVGIDGINLLREDRTEWCLNDNALLCEQGLTDRRIVGGVNFQF